MIMTESDVKRIFANYVDDDNIQINNIVSVTIDDFLHIAGFEHCEPTKESMLAHDGGKRGYAEFIETGDFTS